MHLAILMTNIDESDFSAQWPKDGAKFAGLVALVRPAWRFTVFSVKDGEFPEDIGAFDGAIITGSPASVTDDMPWVAQLMGVIREAVAKAVPLFGACFGHQAIAQALGGQVGPSPQGWALGLWQTEVVARAEWMTRAPDRLSLYAAHVEQVVALPPGAEVLTRSPDCPVGGFRIGRAVFTTQYHPEMTPDFVAALVTHLEGEVPKTVTERARAGLAGKPDQVEMAREIAAFFEVARGA
jgi:GMP synthase-like glutamine amidotransferase